MHPDAGVEELRDAIDGAYDEILRLSSVAARLFDMSTLRAGPKSMASRSWGPAPSRREP